METEQSERQDGGKGVPELELALGWAEYRKRGIPNDFPRFGEAEDPLRR